MNTSAGTPSVLHTIEIKEQNRTINELELSARNGTAIPKDTESVMTDSFKESIVPKTAVPSDVKNPKLMSKAKLKSSIVGSSIDPNEKFDKVEKKVLPLTAGGVNEERNA